MTSQEWRTLIAEDAQLTIGTRVQVCWTNSYHYYTAKATVYKINAKTVNVRLLETVFVPQSNTPYPIGNSIQVPRITDIKKWSPNNCVRLLKNT